MFLAIFGWLQGRVKPCFSLHLRGFWSKLGVVFGSIVARVRLFDLWSIKHVWRAIILAQCPAQRLLRFEELGTSRSAHVPSIPPYLPCSSVMSGGTSLCATYLGLAELRELCFGALFLSFWNHLGERFEPPKPTSIRSHVPAPSKADILSHICLILDPFLVPWGVSHGWTGLVTSPFRT